MWRRVLTLKLVRLIFGAREQGAMRRMWSQSFLMTVFYFWYILERKVFSCCCRVLVFPFYQRSHNSLLKLRLPVWELENFKLKNDKYLVQWKTILKIFTFVCFVINSLCVCGRLFVYIINIFDRLKNRVMITLSVFKLGFYVSCLVTSD